MRRRGSAPSSSHQKRSRPRKRWGSGLWRDIGSSPREIKRHGVALKPRAVSASERVVRFADGSELAVDGVIWATGYQPDYSWIRAPVLDPKGLANHRRGVTDVSGLYFLGLTWQHTRGSALALVAEMDMGMPEGPVVYGCPMHPEVVIEEPDRCPKCGKKLLAVAAPSSYACPMHPDVFSDKPDRCPKCGMKLMQAALVEQTAEHHAHHSHSGAETGGIEWEDDMVEVNRMTTPANTRWNIIDRSTGAVNQAIDWQFRVGDQVKLRLVNEMEPDHPMHHPFHVHGAGRFVVLARDGVAEQNLSGRTRCSCERARLSTSSST